MKEEQPYSEFNTSELASLPCPLTGSQLTQALGDHSGCGPSPCRAFYTQSPASVQDDTLVLWPFQLFTYLTDDGEVIRKPISLFWIYIIPHVTAGKGL